MTSRTLRVLVVDDDEEDFLILRDLLADYPVGRYELDWVPSLVEGERALRAGSHDVYLVDYLLGPDNGLDLVRMAVSESRVHRPVILLTGHGNLEVDREALAAGASDYLIKGNIDAEKLARSIRYAAERTRHLSDLDDSQQRYRRLFEGSPIPAWVYHSDSGRFVAVNDAMVRRYGYSREELLQMSNMDIRSPAEAERLGAYLAQRGDHEGDAGVWQHLHKDGSPIWVEITSHTIVLDGRTCRMTIGNDITARREAEARLQLLERAVQSSSSGVVICDATTPELPIIFVNNAFERMTGYTTSEAVGRNCRFLQGDDVDQAELERIRRALRAEESCDVVLRNYRKDGQLFWNHLMVSPVRDERGQVSHFVGVQTDLTERRRVEAELVRLASHDVITGLPRYAILDVELDLMLAEEGAELAVMFIDIDRFHGINESLGSNVGDVILRTVADRLLTTLGDRGRLSRFGGDEFVALIPGHARPDVLEALGHSMRAAVAAPIDGPGYRLSLTVSIGISHAPLHGRSGSDLLRRAEAAMTRAKRHGRDAVREFTAAEMQELEDRLLLGARLREAPRLGELELHYQPLVRVRDGAVQGFEGLLRWSNPELGRVSPARFIPIAETLGLMVEIGNWVINEACRQIRAWDDAGLSGFTVSVNFSAQELQRPDVVAMVREAIERHAVPAGRLEIEITESSLMEHVDRVVGVMAELKQLGVRLALDDFGTGYSSLAYLRQFSLDKLKIDRSFVKDLPLDGDAGAIARTIIGIGHQLRMDVVAEGVETPEQATFLREMGCDQLQGYLFSPPVPPASAITLLQTGLVSGR